MNVQQFQPLYRIPESSYLEWLRLDLARIEYQASEAFKKRYSTFDSRRFGQRFSDYFRLDRLTSTVDCVHAQAIYYSQSKEVTDALIAQILDKGQ